MQNLREELISVLEQDQRFFSKGKFLQNVVVESALSLDASLLRLLLQNDGIKGYFFQDVDGVLVFDKVKFQEFASNTDFLPSSFTAFKNKIGLRDRKGYLKESKDIVLTWAYKDCVLEGGMTKEDEGRDEIFYNTTLAPDEITRLLHPKVLAKFERWDLESVKKKRAKAVKEIKDTDSLLIKGNNLIALHSLKQRYAGKVDLIYIDPPYNPPTKTNTFVYNNSFNRSSWLTFMKNRLDVAKQLLTKDGVLVVAIDDNEFYYLGCLLKEIFRGYETHCITIVHNPRGVQGGNFSYTHEYAYFVIPQGKKSIGNRKIEKKDIQWRNLRDNGGESLREDAKNCFYPFLVKDGEVVGFGDVLHKSKHPAKQSEVVDGMHHVYPIDNAGVERKWRYARQTVDAVKHLIRAKRSKTGYEIEIGKDFGSYLTVWKGARYDSNENGTKILKSLVPDCQFSYPKSLYNVYDCLYAVVGENKNALVLDFFAGSGTTAHALMQMNKDDGGDRKFIMVEQMDYIKDLPEARVKAVIQKICPKESFVYCEIMEWNERFIQKIRKSDTAMKLEKIYQEMKQQAFFRYDVDLKPYKEDGFKALSVEAQGQALLACLEMNHLYVNLSEIDDTEYGVSEEDKKLNRKFYGDQT